jgi:hypothetical protein
MSLEITQVTTLLSCVIFAALIPIQSIIVFIVGVMFGVLLTVTFIDIGLVNASTISLSWLFLEVLSVIIVAMIRLLRYLAIFFINTKTFIATFVKRLISDRTMVNHIDHTSLAHQDVCYSLDDMDVDSYNYIDGFVHLGEEMKSSRNKLYTDEQMKTEKNFGLDENEPKQPESNDEVTKEEENWIIKSKETQNPILVTDVSELGKYKESDVRDIEDVFVSVTEKEMSGGKESGELMYRIKYTRNGNSNEKLIEDLIALSDLGNNDKNPAIPDVAPDYSTWDSKYYDIIVNQDADF